MITKKQIEEIFLAYDIRGKYPDQLNEEVTSYIAKATKQLFPDKNILVAHDCRTSSFPLSESFIASIDGNTLHVNEKIKYLGIIPNGACYFWTYQEKNSIGVYITASHVPPPVNGIKFIRDDGTSFLSELNELKNKIISLINNNINKHIIPQNRNHSVTQQKTTEVQKSKSRVLSLSLQEKVIDAYIKFLAQKFPIYDEISIGIDCLYGTTSWIIPFLKQHYKNIDINVIRQANENILDFNGIKPDPTADPLENLKQIIQEHGLDLGVAFDGDGDRAVFVDGNGKILDGSIASATFVKLMGTLIKKKTILVPVDSSDIYVNEILSNGGNVEWIRIGHSFIEEALKEKNAIFAGETSCHYYFPDILPFSCGILATAAMMSLLTKNNEKLSHIVENFPKTNIIRKKIQFRTHEEKTKNFLTLKEKLESLKNSEPSIQITTIDGIRLDFSKDNFWLLVRPSNTEPVIRIAIETKKQQSKKLDDLVEMLNI